MPCKGCEERRQQMKAWLKQIADSAKRLADARSGKLEGNGNEEGSAVNASAQYREQGVAEDTTAGASEGRVSVSGMQEVGSGKGRSRGSRKQ